MPAAADAWLLAPELRDDDVCRRRAEPSGWPSRVSVHHFMARSIREFLTPIVRTPRTAIYLRNGEPPEVGDVIVQRPRGMQGMSAAERRANARPRTRLGAVREYFYRSDRRDDAGVFASRRFFTQED
jgi:hypothetical protein